MKEKKQPKLKIVNRKYPLTKLHVYLFFYQQIKSLLQVSENYILIS